MHVKSLRATVLQTKETRHHWLSHQDRNSQFLRLKELGWMGPWLLGPASPFSLEPLCMVIQWFSVQWKVLSDATDVIVFFNKWYPVYTETNHCSQRSFSWITLGVYDFFPFLSVFPKVMCLYFEHLNDVSIPMSVKFLGTFMSITNTIR